MRFTRLKLDAQNVQLDRLHAGLNFVYWPAIGQLASPLAEILASRDVLTGGAGVAMHVETDEGRQGEIVWRPGLSEPQIHGASEADQRAVSAAWQSLRSESAVVVDFHDPTALSLSVRRAFQQAAAPAGEQFPWTDPTHDLEIDWDRWPKKKVLQARLQDLQSQLEVAQRRLLDAKAGARPRGAPLESLDSLTGDASRLRAIENARWELQAIDHELAEARSAPEASGLLRSIEAQIERVQRVCLDVQQRQESVRQQLSRVEAAGEFDRSDVADLRQVCDALNQQIDRLSNGEVEHRVDFDDDYGGYDYEMRDRGNARSRLRDQARTLSDTARSLQGLLEQQAVLVRRQALEAEAKHLRKCYSNLRSRLKRLKNRRDAMRRSPAHDLHRERLLQRRADVVARLRDLERRLDPAHLAGAGAVNDPFSWGRLVAERSDDVRRLERQIVELRDELYSLSREENRSPTTPMAGGFNVNWIERQASALLRRVSAGHYDDLRWDAERITLSVACPDGARRATSDVSIGTQRLAALCVILAAATRQPATPVILDNLLTLIESERHPAVLQLLSEFSREGRQVVVVLSRVEDSRLCESLGLSVTHGSSVVSRSAWTAPFDAPSRADVSVAPPADSTGRLFTAPVEQVSKPIYDWPTRSRSAEPLGVHTTSTTAATLHSPFGGRPAADMGRASASRNERFPLDFLDLVSQAPFLDEEDSRALESAGVWNVADFIRADAEELHRRLRGRASTSVLRAWQAQALLLCSVARLRPYDARILVACGITDPVQLQHMEPVELARVVERFSRSPQGREMLRSGSPFELARVQRWIESAQRTQHIDDGRILSQAAGDDASARVPR